jgi:hypothetical protein
MEKSKSDKLFEQIHTLADCIVKHQFTIPVYTLETVQAAIQKGLDPAELIAIHQKAIESAEFTLSLLLPDNEECIAKISELWQAIGWMNGLEEHMLRKHEEFSSKEDVCPELEPFIKALPKFMHANRLIRRRLEETAFRGIAEAWVRKDQPTLLGAADDKTQ